MKRSPEGPVTSASYHIDRKWWKSLEALHPNEQRQATAAVEQYLEDHRNPGLNLERSAGNDTRLWTMRASREVRILLARDGDITVFLRVGRHDDIYDLIPRIRYSVPAAGSPGLIAIRAETRDIDGTEMPLFARREMLESSMGSQALAQHWEHRFLSEAGYTENEIKWIREPSGVGAARLPDDKLDLLFRLDEITPSEWQHQRLLDDEAERNARFREAIVERGVGETLSEALSADELRTLLRAPIEDWMIFLHPDQRAVVRRRFSGVARVSGAAGTGKTVVALHRAAELARREPVGDDRALPILFTTYIRSLPATLNTLYQRLPKVHNREVRFINIDSLASRYLNDTGEPSAIDYDLENRAFNQAYRQVATAGSRLQRARFTTRYLKDEIERVIKGRMIDTLDHYLEIDRLGRTRRFDEALRREVWELSKAFRARMDELGIMTHADVARRALDIADARGLPSYSGAIVDEVQDLLLVHLQLVRALVNGSSSNDGPDSLLMVGDAAQRVYPGGFTLQEAGIEIRGSSVVLRKNYRNTHEILEASMSCTGQQEIVDMDGSYRRDEAASDSDRAGLAPQLVRAVDLEDQARFIADRITELFGSDDLLLTDIGVLAPYNNTVKELASMLKASGVGVDLLDSRSRLTADGVRAATFQRSKGLEFKVVFIVGMSLKHWPSFPYRRSATTDEEYEEQLAMDTTQLHVAMTRARDGLYVLYSGQPSPLLEGGLACFTRVSTARVLHEEQR